jgi:ABC-2 type transport system permease protein
MTLLTSGTVDETVTATTPIGAQDLPVRPSVRDTLSQSLAMAWRALKKMRRNPEQWFDVTIQPLLFTAMFAYIFGGAISGNVESYLPIIITGILAQTALTACMATGIQLREDMDKGVFDRFKSLPIARIAPLVGPAIADLIRYGTAATLVAGWSLAWIFTWLGTIARSAQAVQGISMMIMFPLTFLSNAFVPVSTLPGWLEAFVKVNPVSLVISAVRDLMNDGAVTANVGWALLGCAIVVAIFLPLSVRSYSRKM